MKTDFFAAGLRHRVRFFAEGSGVTHGRVRAVLIPVMQRLPEGKALVDGAALDAGRFRKISEPNSSTVIDDLRNASSGRGFRANKSIRPKCSMRWL